MHKLASTYTQQLEEWVVGASTDNRDWYLAVADNLLQIEVDRFDLADVLIDCQGLGSMPPLPTKFARRISLVLKGQPNIPLQAFLADLPKYAVGSLTFCDNDTITAFSSEIVSCHHQTLHIKNCPNFTHFVGEFTVDRLMLSNITVQTLSFCRDNFPCLSSLQLNDNSNLTSIQVKGTFPLRGFTIHGNHSNLATFPPFSQIESIDIDPLGLASISDYSWFFNKNLTLRWPLVPDVIMLIENHHKEGKVDATPALIKMAESILTSSELDQHVFASDATHCLEVLLGESAAASFGPPELVLGKLFLDGKLVERDEKKADMFFQLALEREKSLTQTEMLKKMIEFLPHWDFYRKTRLFSLLKEEANLPTELHQLIFSAGSKEMIGTDFTLRQQRQEEKKKRKQYWY